MLLVLLLVVLSSAVAVGIAFSFAGVTAAVLASVATGVVDSALPALIAATAGLAVVRGLVLWGKDVAASALAGRVTREVRSRLRSQLWRLGPETSHGSTSSLYLDGVEHLRGYVGFYLPQLLASWIVPAALVGILATRSISVAMLVLACVLLVPFAQRLWRLLLRRRASDHWDRYEAFAEQLTDTIRGLPTLVALGALGRRRRRIEQSAEELRMATSSNMRASLGVSAVITGAMSIGTSGATVLAAILASTGRLAVSDVLLVLFLAAECFRPQQDLSTYWHEGFYGIAAAGRIERFLARTPSVTDAPGAVARELDAAPAIAVRDLVYRYPGEERAVLDGLSFSVPAGATLAIVGRSGAGKSTLGRLLLRDLDPESGSVLWNDAPLSEHPLAQVRSASARVDQDVVLLSGSVRENIGLLEGAEATSASRLLAELERDLPQGLDTPVGERGRLISGGQRQRVALARALHRGARVLLLDEATSALDAENESLVTELMAQPSAERTTVVIAHRLSTVVHADLLLVLEEGRIAEFGSPAELALAGGPWSRMLAVHRREVQAGATV